MSKIPPLAPQIGNIVGFEFVGKFNSTWRTRRGISIKGKIKVVGCGK
jgi:hypothetical protein